MASKTVTKSDDSDQDLKESLENLLGDPCPVPHIPDPEFPEATKQVFEFVSEKRATGAPEFELLKHCEAYRALTRKQRFELLEAFIDQKMISAVADELGLFFVSTRYPVQLSNIVGLSEYHLAPDTDGDTTPSAPPPKPPTGAPDDLNEEQAAAYLQMMEFVKDEHSVPTMVLRGYAGTGKTYVVGKLVAELQWKFTVGVAAPTNKAVKVLREKMVSFGVRNFGCKKRNDRQWERDEWDGESNGNGVMVGTIHSFLGMKMKEMDDGTQKCQKERESSIHELDLLIVDEASMVGGEMFQMILKHRRDTKVLFVGDPAQLSPVSENGAMSPVFNAIGRTATLSTVVRQAQGNPIIRLSMAIREYIERGVRMTPGALVDCVPDESPCPIGVVYTVPEEIAAWCIDEQRAGRDCRILCFTNPRVDFYNRMVHEALHGPIMPGTAPFVEGEAIIINTACDAQQITDEMQIMGETVYMTLPAKLHTSQELRVKRIVRGKSPAGLEDIQADRLFLIDDSGNEFSVFYPHAPDALNRKISDLFSESKTLKDKAAITSTPEKDRMEMTKKSKSLSGRGWALKGAFAPVRHSYALTTHKSQGSTFDTTLVDMGDLNRIRNDAEFSRALYVACTRSAQYLAICL